MLSGAASYPRSSSMLESSQASQARLRDRQLSSAFRSFADVFEPSSPKPTKIDETPEIDDNSNALPEGIPILKKFRNFCGLIVNHTITQALMTMLILANALTMGLATYPFVTENPEMQRKFVVMDTYFLIIYTIEWCLHLINRGLSVFRDRWLLFDFFIVASSWAFESIQVIRSLRIVRASRIFRSLRIISKVKFFRHVILAIQAVIPDLAYIFMLMGLSFYIYVVLFTAYFGDMYESGLTSVDYFSRIDLSAFTLFQVMCIDDWSTISREVSATYSWAGILFLVYLLCLTFTLLNMVIAVFCRSVHELQALSQRQLTEGYPELLEDRVPEPEPTMFDEINEIEAILKTISLRQRKYLKEINELIQVVKCDIMPSCSEDSEDTTVFANTVSNVAVVVKQVSDGKMMVTEENNDKTKLEKTQSHDVEPKEQGKNQKIVVQDIRKDKKENLYSDLTSPNSETNELETITSLKNPPEIKRDIHDIIENSSSYDSNKEANLTTISISVDEIVEGDNDILQESQEISPKETTPNNKSNGYSNEEKKELAVINYEKE